jgi:DNA repair protein RadC
MRGRERMVSEGAGFLSEEELVAVLLGSGTRAHPVSEVAARLLRGGLEGLRRAPYGSLVELPGMGEAQACRVLAALELGRRAVSLLPCDRSRLSSAGVVARRLFPRLALLGHEEFWVLLLTARLEEMRAVRVSMGGLTHCSVLPREALAPALVHCAPVILFAHNHPSGDPAPSADDRRLQLLLDQSARTLGLRVADHVVLAETGMHSLREGLLPPPPPPDDLEDADDPYGAREPYDRNLAGETDERINRDDGADNDERREDGNGAGGSNAGSR